MMVSPRVEVSGRYSRLSPLADNADGTFSGANEFNAGLGYYAHGHDLKVQGDVSQISNLAPRGRARHARIQLQLFF
jgi:hypothetical protein